MTAKQKLIDLLRWVGDQLFPAVCPVCGRLLARGERTVCLSCRWDMPFTDYWKTEENPLELALRERIPCLVRAAALLYFRHGSGYRKMIHSFKYGGRRDIAVALGEMFGRELHESPLYGDVDILVPVPLHWSKRIARGYNQAEEICIGMSRSMRTACDFRSLKRVRRTGSQALRRDAGERRGNVEGAFRLRRPERLRGKHILLVDDVLTTGATTAACAEAIRRRLPDARISVAALATVQGRSR